MALNFEKYTQEANLFIKELARELGHEEETGTTGILLRAVMHTLRDRITISESFDILAQLPMYLKAVYVDNWKYLEKPLNINSVEEFKEEVKKRQEQYGERDFDWEEPTVELVGTVLHHLGQFITEGEAENIAAQLPEELRSYFKDNVMA